MSFQVLSLSGGGYLGLYTASILAQLEEHYNCRIADHFDLIAGTSVGGIIALGLANRTPAQKIVDAFTENGPKVFSEAPPPSSIWGNVKALKRNMFRPNYRSDQLRTIIAAVVGEDTKIGDLKHRVLIPAVNLSKGEPQVFKTPHHPTFVRDAKLTLIDVALATSAAPTFFPLHRIGGELFADGGLYANAPDLFAVHESEHFLHQDVAEISLLSIGTTTSRFSFSNSIGTDLGWKQWMQGQRLPNVMIAAQQLSTEYMLQHRLGERYVRIDHEQSKEQERSLSLDSASKDAIADLLALAEASSRSFIPKNSIASMFKHQSTQLNTSKKEKGIE